MLTGGTSDRSTDSALRLVLDAEDFYLNAAGISLNCLLGSVLQDKNHPVKLMLVQKKWVDG